MQKKFSETTWLILAGIVVLIVSVFLVYRGNGYYDEFFIGTVTGVVQERTEEEFRQFPWQEVYVDVGEKTVLIDSRYGPLRQGQDVVVLRVSQQFKQRKDVYYVVSSLKTTQLGAIALVFFLSVIVVCGKKGARALLSLILLFFLTIWGIVPILLQGFFPSTISIVLAVLALAGTLLVTYGMRRSTFIVIGGILISLFLCALLLLVLFYLSGFSGLYEDSLYELFFLPIFVSPQTLLFLGLLIGMFGVLDDVAVTQVSVVEQLAQSGVTGRRAYAAALEVGRAHVGSLVNTLALAYAGVALPLLVYVSDKLRYVPAGAVFSEEIVYVEVFRVLIGSIGVLITVPIVTWLSVVWVDTRQQNS